MNALFLKAINIVYPGAIMKGDGLPFKRPYEHGEYAADETTGFYYENIDGDRFYFETAEECAEDLATEIEMDEAEARVVVTKAEGK